MSSKHPPGGQVRGTGDDDDRRADMLIKAGGIYSMAETRETDARVHTADAARFVGDGAVRGTLAPGKLADFAAYPADPFTCPDDELAGLLPVLTIVGGRAHHDPRGLITHRDLPTRAAGMTMP